MQRDGKRKWFVMEPPSEPAPAAPDTSAEQIPTFDVYAVLRDHMKYVELIHTELRHARHERQELKMKVSELSSKVDSLISVATDLKGRVDAGSSNTVPGGAMPTPLADDPEIERLAHRIDDAIAVLRGEKLADQPPPGAPSGTQPMGNPFDPNSPVPSEPSVAPPANDPNAPL